jgi:hypothetical protein
VLPAPVERALNAALSRGPGYEKTPIGPAFDDRSVRGYYIDFRSKTIAATGAHPDLLPATPLVQLALGWCERHVAGETGALERFLALCGVIENRGERAGDALLWPIKVTVAKYRLSPPWLSALPQAQAASVFVRAHLSTGHDRYADLALAAIAPLLADRGSELVTQTTQGPILEEAPSDPPSRILNGWIAGLWGLWDVHLGLGDAAAGSAFARGLASLRMHLSSYDTGWWTLYSLYPHAMQDLAKPIYHRLHVDQVRGCYRLTGFDDLGEVADRWQSYDHRFARARALMQKAVFSVVDGRRRRRWERLVGAIR